MTKFFGCLIWLSITFVFSLFVPVGTTNAGPIIKAMNRIGSAALIAMSLLALLFGGLGMALLVKGLMRLAVGHPLAIRNVIAGGLFALVGAGLATAIVACARSLRKVDRLHAEHPAEPWMWREDWAQGHAHGTSGSHLVRAWIWATSCNAIGWITVIFIPGQQYRREPVTLIVWLLPLLGIGLLIWAVRTTIARYYFGKTHLELATLPVPLGGEFRGAIHTRFPLKNDLYIQLSCVQVNRYTVGGESDRPMREILWRERQTISAASAIPGPFGTVIPVSFHVPLGQPPTNSSIPQTHVVWRVEARAKVPGLNYKDVFEIPVFRIKDIPEHENPWLTAVSEQSAPIHAPAHSTITVGPAPEGGNEFYFPAARNRGVAIGVTTVMAVFTGSVVLMVKSGTPALALFAYALGLFVLPFDYFVLGLWFRTSRVVAQSGTLLVCNGWLGIGKTRMIAASEIEDLQARITMRQGGGATATNYYSLRAVLHTARTVVLGQNVRDKEEAEWLVAEMRRIVGIEPKTMTADPVSWPGKLLGWLLRRMLKH